MAKKLSSEWISTQEAARSLGCSTDHLFNLKNEGFLKCGKHWRDIRKPSALRATYRWHLKRVEEKLALPPEKR